MLFLNSWEALRAALKEQFTKVKQIVDELGEPSYQSDKLVENLERLLNYGKAAISYAVLNNFPSSTTAVQIAVGLSRATASTAGRYPDLAKSTLQKLRSEFETKLAELERRIHPQEEGETKGGQGSAL